MPSDVPTSNNATHAEIKIQRTVCQRFIANSLPSFKRARRSTHGRTTAGRLLSRDPFTVKRKTLWVKGRKSSCHPDGVNYLNDLNLLNESIGRSSPHEIHSRHIWSLAAMSCARRSG